jgi:SAM-dependent methyltransferase
MAPAPAAPAAPQGHGHGEPSPWVQRFGRLAAPGASVLDLACGGGRHVRWFAARGARVTAVDRDAAALAPLRELAGVEVIVADLEGSPWPLAAGRRFDAVVVTNYLWRALLPRLVQAVAPGGWLIYETFAQGNGTVGKPSNPDFLLRPGELLQAVAGRLRVVAYEDGMLEAPLRFVQRIAAVHEAGEAAGPAPRHPLQP